MEEKLNEPCESLMSTLEECKTCDYSLKLGNRRKTMNNRLEVNRNK